MHINGRDPDWVCLLICKKVLVCIKLNAEKSKYISDSGCSPYWPHSWFLKPFHRQLSGMIEFCSFVTRDTLGLVNTVHGRARAKTRGKSCRDLTHVQAYSTSEEEEVTCYGLGSVPRVSPSHVTGAEAALSKYLLGLFLLQCHNIFLTVRGWNRGYFGAFLFMIGPPWVDRANCNSITISYFISSYWPILQIFTCL